jgi:hypothetical protein
MARLPAQRGEESFALRRGSFLFASHLALGWILSSGVPLPAGAITLPPPAPPLPPPSGSVVNVATVTQLQNAVAALASNTTVLIAPGTYRLTQTLRIRGGLANDALRGSTGNRNDVVLLGSGMNTSGAVNICVTGEDATDILIADISI